MKITPILFIFFLLFIIIKANEKPPKPNMRLIEYGNKRTWIPEEKIESLHFVQNERFIDVTDTQDLEKNQKKEK